jgi:hypothetical protein
MARLLANGEQYFANNNGAPLAGGFVYFYIPTTSTFKDTWQDADEGALNTNPVELDSAGRAIIYGSGEYRQVVTDSLGNEIWDQLTSTFDAGGSTIVWGGTSTGTGNAQIIAPEAVPDSLIGQLVAFFAGASNTASMTLKVGGFDPYFVVKDTDAGPTQLTGGEVVEDNLVTCMFDDANQVFHVIEYAPNDLVLKTLKVNRVRFGNSISPAAIAANTDDWNPTGLSTTSNVRISSTAPFNLTGISAQSPGQMIFLDNVGSFPITLTVNDTASLAANRFAGQADITVNPAQSVILKYDQPAAQWRIYAITAGSVLPMKGLKIVTVGTLQATLTAARMPVVNTDNIGLTLFNVNVTGNLGTSGVGGLDTGTVAASTGYYIWLIYNPTTGVADMLLSLSASAPTLPAGYTYKARLGWVVTTAGTVVRPLLQYGPIARYTKTASIDLPEITSGAAGSTSSFVAVTVVGYLPQTAPVITVLTQANADNYAAVAPNNNYVPTLGSGDSVSASFNSATPTDLILESSNLYYSCGAEGGALWCLGWIDDIG